MASYFFHLTAKILNYPVLFILCGLFFLRSFFFSATPNRPFLVEILADIVLTNFVAVQLRSTVQRSPLWLILEESHGMHILINR